MSALDYDLCPITQERFSPDTNSDLCPVVGECGHSFTKQGIQNWYEGRKTDEYHKRKSYVQCAYNCARKRGQRKEELIRAFKPDRLVPNVALCEALAVIRRVEADKSKMGDEEFVHCSICKTNYSVGPSASGGIQQHHPRAPIVGVCGHTCCASCIYDKHQQAMQDSNCDRLRCLRCPHCHEKGAFHTEHLVLNQSLKDALMYWEEIEDRIDYKDLYRKEKANCNALKELHEKEMEVQKDLLKKKTSEYDALKVKHEREMEAQTQRVELSRKKEARYKHLYERKASEYDALKVQHDKEVEAKTKSIALCRFMEDKYKEMITQRDLYKKKAAEDKQDTEAQIAHKNLYEKKTVEHKSLRVTCNNEIETYDAIQNACTTTTTGGAGGGEPYPSRKGEKVVYCEEVPSRKGEKVEHCEEVTNVIDAVLRSPSNTSINSTEGGGGDDNECWSGHTHTKRTTSIQQRPLSP